MHAKEFFRHLWEDYSNLAPHVSSIKRSLEQRGEQVENDHVAFRTFDRAPIHLEALEPYLLALGYRRYEPYHFEEKKLRAFGYVHPEGFPRVFLSELETARCSPKIQEAVARICAQAPAPTGPEVFWSGRTWEPLTYSEFLELDQESEYAAWVAAHGLRPNHFTVSVNALQTLPTLEQLLDYVESLGFQLNTSGGRVKGSPEVLLEQGSTLADRLPVDFADDMHTVPTCYYEFARRYPGPDGKLYEGFVAASADKIFESTNLKDARSAS